MTRTDRLLSIVLALQARRWQRAEDLAEMLAVSPRTIYRDMSALGEAGVPLVAVPGRGYSLSEGYFLPPLMFTTDEAVMLLLGSDYAAQHFDDRYHAASRTAAKKLQAILPEALLEEVTALQESLRFVPINVFDHPAEQARLQQLRRALVEQRAVRFRYGARPDSARPDSARPDSARPDDAPWPGSDGPGHTVDPYGLVAMGGTWYLVGFCHARRDVRHYALGRMDGLALLDKTFDRPAGYRLRRDNAADGRDLVVRVRFDAHAAPWVREATTRYVADVEALPDGLLVTLRVRREAEVIPWLLGWGAHARVLEPASLRHRLATEAERIAAQYHADLLLLS